MYIILGAIAVVVILLIVLFTSTWRVAEPNVALVISGLGERGQTTVDGGEDVGFRIITGKGALIIPGLQKVRKLSLDLHQSDLDVACVTSQGIPVHVKGTVIYKVGNDQASMANAAQRILDQQENLDKLVHNVFAGHLRSIIGSMTVEQMIGDREMLTAKTREASSSEMSKLGLIIDSLQIQEISDPTGYIENLAMPHTAAVASKARIAQADADREATEREQLANALMAEAKKVTSIKEAEYQAEVQRAQATMAQAAPLAEASARQAVVQQQTTTARLEAEREQARLVATVIRPAEAKRDADIASAEAASRVAELTAEGQAKRVTLEATANADAIRATGLAEAEATTAKGKAEGAAIEARAKALGANSEAVIMQELAKQWPAIVAAAAGAFEHVDNFTVLNGAEGVNAALMQVVGTALNSFKFAKGMFATTDSNEAKGAKVSESNASSIPAAELVASNGSI